MPPILALALACAAAAAGPQQTADAPLPVMPVTRLDDRARHAALDEPRPLSLTSTRPLSVRDTLLLLFRGTPFSIVVDPAVTASFAGELKNVTLRQALESILESSGLDYALDGSILSVFPRRQQTRFFSIDHLHLTRGSVDAFTEIGAGVQAILSATGKYQIDRKAALLSVTDFAQRIGLVAAYLESAHLRLTRQVRLQAGIYEVARPDGTPIDWAALAGRAGSGIRKPLDRLGTGAAQSGAGWHVDDVGQWLQTMAEGGPVRHIAAPALLATNNEPAIVRTVDSAIPSELRLTVTAQIAADRIIQLHVAPTYVDGPFTATLDTVVRVVDGDTVLVGGLMRRHDPAAPTEVVVLLTATTVSPAMPPAGGTR
jgi:type II secretory pathway component GspD/PulD (secretin)